MTKGITIDLPELIALRRYAQMTRHHTEGKAATRVGHHQSQRRGRGMDFSEARNYQAGDEVRHMEWRVTARTGRPHVKVYHEERERPVVIFSDFNPSMYFGTRIAFKSVTATRLAAIIAWTVTQQGDRVGGLIFSAQTHHEFLPRSRQTGVLPFLASLSQYSQLLSSFVESPQEQDNFNHALRRLRRVTKPGSRVVLISDFYGLNENSEKYLSRLCGHNDVLAYHICDPLELAAPQPQVYTITDGKQELILDTTLDSVRFDYQFYCEQRLRDIHALFKRLNIQCTQVTANLDLALLVKQTFPWRVHG